MVSSGGGGGLPERAGDDCGAEFDIEPIEDCIVIGTLGAIEADILASLLLLLGPVMGGRTLFCGASIMRGRQQVRRDRRVTGFAQQESTAVRSMPHWVNNEDISLSGRLHVGGDRKSNAGS